MCRVPCARVVALAGALILVAGCSSGSTSSAAPSASLPATTPATGAQLPSDDVIAILEGRIAAWNRGDGAAAAAFYAEDATLLEEDGSGVVTTGRAQIAARLQGLIDMGFTLEAVGTPIQWGVIVVEPGNLILDGQPLPLVMVFQLGPDGREIARQWVLPGAPYD